MTFSDDLKPRLFKLLLAFLLLGTVVLLRILEPGPVTGLRDLYFDRLQQAHPRVEQNLPVLIVDINDESLEALGQWPWPRTLIAGMVDRLAEAGAIVLAFDILFSEPDRFSPKALASDPFFSRFLQQDPSIDLPDTDDILAHSFQNIPVILGVAAQVGGTRSELPARSGIVEIGDNPLVAIPRFPQRTQVVPALSAASAGFGNINVSPFESMEVIRRVPMLWQHGEQTLPTLALETLRVALGENTLLAFSTPENPSRLGQIRVGGAMIPVDARGQFQVYYRRSATDFFLPAHQIFEFSPAELRARVDGSIVFVGTSAAGLLDIRQTALGENIPGVAIHAQILEQILQDSYLIRDLRIEVSEVITLFLLSLSLLIMIRYVTFKYTLIFVILSLGMLHIGAYLAFVRQGFLFDAANLSALFGAAFLAVFSFSYYQSTQERKMIRASFSRYVAPSILKEIELNRHQIKMGGEIKDITVMFCDLRNFTSLSEGTNPQNLMEFVNEVFSEVTEKIISNSGFVDKFIGDAVMALWNAPLDVPYDAAKACKAALEVRHALSEHQSALHKFKGVPVAIGIAKGPACIGNIGSLARMNYSAIGQAVNFAARLEQGCRSVGYDILVSKSVAAEATDFAFLPAGTLALKGMRDRQEANILVGDKRVRHSEAFKALHSQHLHLVEAIRFGHSDIDISKRLKICLQYSEDVSNDLTEFYEAVAGRLDDFRVS